MKIHKHLGRLWLNLGWFPGEEFVLFGLDILEIVELYNGGVESITFLSVQVAHGIFCCGVDLV